MFFLFFSKNHFFADFVLVCYYFARNELQYGVITLTIVVIPSLLIQIYSLWLLRSDSSVSAKALMMHILLLGIPYRYQNILHKIARKEISIQEDEEHNIELIVDRIRDVNAIQTVNAIFQYCPQFLFQSFLIIYRHYKSLITGIFSSTEYPVFLFFSHFSFFVFEQGSQLDWLVFHFCGTFSFIFSI